MSSKENFNYPDSERGGIYQEWKIKIEESYQSTCAKWRYWNPRYMLCTRSVLPQTHTVTFAPSSWWDRTVTVQDGINWEEPVFNQEDPLVHLKGAFYTGPCEGDSGAPEMAQSYSSHSDEVPNIMKSKYVLVAVHTGTYYNIKDGYGVYYRQAAGLFT